MRENTNRLDLQREIVDDALYRRIYNRLDLQREIADDAL